MPDDIAICYNTRHLVSYAWEGFKEVHPTWVGILDASLQDILGEGTMPSRNTCLHA